MLPFSYVVLALVGGLNEATATQIESVRMVVVAARYLTAIVWHT